MAWKLSAEPAAVFNGLGELLKAAIPVAIIFDLIHWSDKQTALVMYFSGVAVTVLASWFIRSGSVSLPVANKQIEVAKASEVSRPTAEIVAQAAKEAA